MAATRKEKSLSYKLFLFPVILLFLIPILFFILLSFTGGAAGGSGILTFLFAPAGLCLLNNIAYYKLVKIFGYSPQKQTLYLLLGQGILVIILYLLLGNYPMPHKLEKIMQMMVVMTPVILGSTITFWHMEIRGNPIYSAVDTSYRNDNLSRFRILLFSLVTALVSAILYLSVFLAYFYWQQKILMSRYINSSVRIESFENLMQLNWFIQHRIFTNPNLWQICFIELIVVFLVGIFARKFHLVKSYELIFLSMSINVLVGGFIILKSQGGYFGITIMLLGLFCTMGLAVGYSYRVFGTQGIDNIKKRITNK